MGKWKYPQWLSLAAVLVLTIQFCNDVTRSPKSVEAFSGAFGPWRLRLTARERVAPGEHLVLTAWISSHEARPNYKRLLISVAGSGEAAPTTLVGAGLARRGRLRVPASAGGSTKLLLRAELWDGTSMTKTIPVAPLVGLPGR